jgi:hypothetical protein
MKTTTTTNKSETINEFEVARIQDARIAKIALVLFSSVLTICCFQFTF